MFYTKEQMEELAHGFAQHSEGGQMVAQLLARVTELETRLIDRETEFLKQGGIFDLQKRVAELCDALENAERDLLQLAMDTHKGNEYRNGWMNFASESADRIHQILNPSD